MSESTEQHRKLAGNKSATCCVLTISDTRTKSDDKSGRIIVDNLEAAGHIVRDYTIKPDEPVQIREQLKAWLDQPGCDAICSTGGTGIASRDTTIEVVRELIDKELEGFGELVRMLSWDEVGPAAILSRAVAGLAGQTLLFTMPGSSNAVKLAMSRLIIPELPHLIWERKR